MIETEDQARSFVEVRAIGQGMVQLETLALALLWENERQNLVSRGSLGHVWQRHFADSAQLLDHVPRGTGPWLDLGAGAGFPGLVIACLQPDLEVVLVESRKRRIEWLEHAIGELGLKNARVEGSRLEALPTLPVAVISARAFAPLPKLLHLSARFSTRDTHWVLPKGRSAEQEWRELPKGLRRMFHVKHSFTDEKAGIIVGKGKAEIGS